MTENGNNNHDGTPDEYPLDFEGCEQDHCHGRRSLRQEAVLEHIQQTGMRPVCHRPAGWGTRHVGTGRCKLHGGGTQSAATHAAKVAVQSTAKLLGTPVDTGPSEALLKELRETAGIVAWLRSIVQQLEQDDLVWGMVEEVQEPDIRDLDHAVITSQVSGKFRAVPSAWYELYMRERQHLVRVCAEAIKAGVSERLVSLYENEHGQVAEVYMGLLERVLLRLELTPDQRKLVPAAVVSEVRLLQGSVITDE